MKKIFALTTLLFTIMLVGVCAQAADFEPVTTVLKTGDAFEPYSDQIVMKDGNAGYSFEMLSSGLYPAGLTVSSTGAVTGTPTVSGSFPNISVRVTNGTETRVIFFSIRILPKPIKVSVTAGTYEYDGQNHYATVKCYDPDDMSTELTGITPIVKYGTSYLDAAKDVGEYVVNVYAPSGYTIINPIIGDTLLEITPLAVTNLSVKDYTTDFTGNPISIPTSNISVNPSVSYEVEYAASDSSSYTTTPPTAAGVYTVRVHTTDPNYETAYAEGIMRINSEGVTFTVTGDTSVEYDGNSHTLTVVSNPSVAFTYEYINAATGDKTTTPTNAGTYNLSISITDSDKYSMGGITGPTTLVITPKQVKFTVPSTVSYTGAQQTPTVTTDPVIANTMYDVSYTLAPNAAQSYVQETGTYDVAFTFKDEYKDNYVVAADSSKTISVGTTPITFTVSGNKEFTYGDGVPHTVTLTPNPNVAGYDVTYTNTTTGDVIKLSEHSNGPDDAGTYSVNVVFPANSGYSAVLDPTTITVNKKSIKFELDSTTIPYDNQDHTPVVTATPSIDSSLYTVKYQQNSQDKTIHDAGVYDVVIEFTGNNSKNYDKSADSVSSLTVTPIKVFFAVTGATQTPYDGNPHTTTVDVDHTDPAGHDSDVPAYYITYQKGSDTPSADMTDVGEYSIIVTFNTPTDNYIVDPDFDAKYTITAPTVVTSMNYGNSPAAMIYKDTAAEHDDTWKANAIAYLTANRKFGTYLPTGFESYIGDITYPLIGSVDVDADPNTVLVSGYDLSGFVDPGMVVDGNTITGSAPVLDNTTGLYKVTYTHDGSKVGTRYVVLVNRLGDANANKMVNAIDSNYIEKYIAENKGSNNYAAPANATQARAWDVTKDGKLDEDDVAAIRNRFRTTLIPYYPWI